MFHSIQEHPLYAKRPTTRTAPSNAASIAPCGQPSMGPDRTDAAKGNP